MTAAETRQRILELTRAYAAQAWPEKAHRSGLDPVPVSGRVFDGDDVATLVDAALDFWLTSGRFTEHFERDLARFVGVRHALMVNSGSSANLLAVSALTSPGLGERRLVPGDEVLTIASGFPTTLNPILQNGLVPVFLDIQLPTYNVDVSQLEEAIGPRTKAIILAHSLGNPFDLDAVGGFARERGLWLIEDCCDALGSEYRGRKVGTFGDLATLSFFPAHHITTGEGGAVLTNSPMLKKIVESFRDWGRDCWCAPGKANTCGKRFEWQLGTLPAGYDHKYTYSHIGYNLKATDLQAAVGVAQLRKLQGFIERRRANFAHLRDALADRESQLVLPEPTPHSAPSWFGFPLTLKESAPARRLVIDALESQGVATRPMFGGNLLRQPAYQAIPHRTVGPLRTSDRVMTHSFWVGVYPGLTPPMLDTTAATLTKALGGPA